MSLRPFCCFFCYTHCMEITCLFIITLICTYCILSFLFYSHPSFFNYEFLFQLSCILLHSIHPSLLIPLILSTFSTSLVCLLFNSLTSPHLSPSVLHPSQFSSFFPLCWSVFSFLYSFSQTLDFISILLFFPCFPSQLCWLLFSLHFVCIHPHLSFSPSSLLTHRFAIPSLHPSLHLISSSLFPLPPQAEALYPGSLSCRQ